MQADGNAQGSGAIVEIQSGVSPLLIASKEKGEVGGDDPRETPPPWFLGEEFDPKLTCIVDFPRYRTISAKTIAKLDGDYDNQPYSDAAKIAHSRMNDLPVPATPGLYQHDYLPNDPSPALLALAGAGARFGARTHLFYVEFPVNSTKNCIPIAWEHSESWAKGPFYTVQPSRIDHADLTKTGDSTTVPDLNTGRPDPGADLISAPEVAGDNCEGTWCRGLNRNVPGSEFFKEAWIFFDFPGHYSIQLGDAEFGNYMNQRLNIREGSKQGTIRATAIHRLFQLYRNGNFHSEYGGGSVSGTEILLRLPPLDPNLSTDGRPVNTPGTIPSVASGHPLYVGP